jgi:hypothetical protein
MSVRIHDARPGLDVPTPCETSWDDAMGHLEICICAAIQFDDGRVIRGHRHHDCFHTAERMGLSGTPKQGFITSHNRFVDRIEGRSLQDAAQLASADPNGYRATLLFSEDLY